MRRSQREGGCRSKVCLAGNPNFPELDEHRCWPKESDLETVGSVMAAFAGANTSKEELAATRKPFFSPMQLINDKVLIIFGTGESAKTT